MDLISIIIPVYNVESYLKECLESVINQSYKNLEIILVNDGSTDNSLKICESFANFDSRIKIINKTNGGLSDARNVGLKEASGKYISLIDSDDFVDNDYIEYMYRGLVDSDSDISCCQRQEVDEKGRYKENNKNKSTYLIKDNFDCMQDFLKGNGIDTVAWGKLYKLSLFDNITYPLNKFHEDVYTTYKLVSLCNRIWVGGRRKYFYRIRTGSIIQSSFSIKHLDTIYANLERADFIRSRYPELLPLANSKIIYGVNQCILKYCKSINIPEDGFNELFFLDECQQLYRNFTKDFLKGQSSFKAKLFSIFAFINLKVLVKLLRFVYLKK